jgi:hypothetical protein
LKAFQFNLERVLEWYAAQLSVEEAKLSQLNRELARLDASAAFLKESRIDAETTLRAQVCLAGSDLKILDAYLRHARKQEENLRAQRLDTGKRIAGQLERVLSAQRRRRLIGKLRERRHREWTTESNTEIEQLAADTYLAKFNRRD